MAFGSNQILAKSYKEIWGQWWENVDLLNEHVLLITEDIH